MCPQLRQHYAILPCTKLVHVGLGFRAGGGREDDLTRRRKSWDYPHALGADLIGLAAESRYRPTWHCVGDARGGMEGAVTDLDSLYTDAFELLSEEAVRIHGQPLLSQGSDVHLLPLPGAG